LHGLKTKNKVIRAALVNQAAILCWLFLVAPNVFANVLDGIRVHEAPDSIRVVLDARQETQFKQFALQNPHRIVIDLKNTRPGKKLSFAKAGAGLKGIKGIRGAERGKNYRIVIDTKGPLSAKPFKLQPINPYGHRLVVDLFYPTKKKPVVVAKKPRSQEKNRDVVIAIDAGHGGEDPGALGPRKAQEKKVVLSIARRTADQINGMKGFKAVLIRKGDYYIGHRKRTALARESRADLFVSIHADAFKESSVSGASVYTLSDRGATSETAKWLAERANQSDMLGGVGNVNLSDRDAVLAHVLLDMSMDGYRAHSIGVGEAVLRNMAKVTKLHKKKVEQAGFLVLKSPDMSSILVETGFISNPSEAKKLAQTKHQINLAKAIADGIGEYMRANPPPSTLIAARRAELRYTISPGDTLSEIANRYGVSAAVLKRRNKLSSDRIRVGQTIYIPRGA
jgi:N-acetylmuramoyl-L-alanine amidase